jgi:GxxExxY protein
MECELQERGQEEKIIFKELSYEIVAAALEVHKNLGPGFTENIYEAAFCRELSSRGVAFQRQLSVVIQYKGENIGRYQLDLLIDEKVVVELKAVSQIADHFEHQLHAYLKATGKKLGILLNFGKKSLEYKRIAK